MSGSKPRTGYLLRCTLLACSSLAASLAYPEQPPLIARPRHSEPRRALINWGDKRQRLEDQGIQLRSDLLWGGYQVVHGGKREGHHSNWEMHLAAQFDMDRLLAWDGGLFTIAVNNRGGYSTAEDLVGSSLPTQLSYGGQFWRLNELSYRQFLHGGRITLRLGFMPMGDDFGYQLLGCHFASSTFCSHAPSFSRNSGWYNNPIARWGFDYRQRWGNAWLLRSGVFQVNPRYSGLYKDRSTAFSLFTHGSTGAIFPLEMEWIPGRRNHMIGHYKLGVYYDTSSVTRVGHRDRQTEGRHGTYLLVDQTLFHGSAHPERGLRAFAQWMYGDAASANIPHWYATGLAYDGLFGRSKDSLSLGYAHASINRHLLKKLPYPQRDQPFGEMAERVYELTYATHPRPWLTVMPDMQYLIRPGAATFHRYPNAFLFGLLTKIKL